MKYCFRVGLYYQGLMHDLSKYCPEEFITGVKYYQGGNRSSNNGERDVIGYSKAWLHHQGRNKHHYEYWIDYNSRNDGDVMVPIKMPLKYVVEMFLDRIAASRIYNKGSYTDDMPLKYYAYSANRIPMHKETKALLYGLLRMLEVYGEDKTLNFIKRRLLKYDTY
ncbi:MAG: DUF5662 family protein [Lachnospiraceae bacterium]|nr:DUF5662 family protein [Lachnospiraceae bacterium]